MAQWVRALAAQARVAEVRCQSLSNKQDPAHSAATEMRQVETGGGTGTSGLPAQEDMQAPGSAKRLCPKETRQQ